MSETLNICQEEEIHLTGMEDNLRELLRRGGYAVVTLHGDQPIIMALAPDDEFILRRWLSNRGYQLGHF